MKLKTEIEILSPADVLERWPVLSEGMRRKVLEADAAGLQLACDVSRTLFGTFLLGARPAEPRELEPCS